MELQIIIWLWVLGAEGLLLIAEPIYEEPTTARDACVDLVLILLWPVPVAAGLGYRVILEARAAAVRLTVLR